MKFGTTLTSHLQGDLSPIHRTLTELATFHDPSDVTRPGIGTIFALPIPVDVSPRDVRRCNNFGVPWIKLARVLVALTALGALILLATDGGHSTRLAPLGILISCMGGIVLAYVDDPARFHRPLNPRRNRDG